MTPLDQQFVVHVHAPADRPGYATVRELWRLAEQEFALRDPIPRIGLPRSLPGFLADLPSAQWTGPEVALAGQSRAGTACQAILRRHHGVFVLSLALASPAETGWRAWDDRWTALVGRQLPYLIGEDRLYLAAVDDGGATSGPEFGWRAGALLPAVDPGDRWWEKGVCAAPDLSLWELAAYRDDRALRRFVVGYPAASDPQASALVWSRGDTAIPPLARCLLATARLRHALRVWQSAPDTTDHQHRRTELAELRQTVEIVADTMRRSLLHPGLAAPGGPFADDLDLADWLLARLGDDIAYREVDAERARLAARPAVHREQPEHREQPDDDRRAVFVVHGRDEQFRVAVFDFLRALGLRPLEWETLVAATGSTLPTLADVVAQAIPRSQAAVVLMTPDDVVRLHPELADGRDGAPGLQARPNVLIELGMVLNAYRDRTLVLLAGEHRPISDLGGLNVIMVNERPDCRRKIADRLRLARCRVDDSGQDWLDPDRFTGLAAFRRRLPES